MAEFTTPYLIPSPGLVWVAQGLPARAGGLASRRTAALWAARGTAQPGSLVIHDAREVTLLPVDSGIASDLPVTLSQLRADAPQAVLRLEWWLEERGSLDSILAALRSSQPLFVHAVVTAPEQIRDPWPTQAARLADAGVPLAAMLVLRAGALSTWRRCGRCAWTCSSAGCGPT